MHRISFSFFSILLVPGCVETTPARDVSVHARAQRIGQLAAHDLAPSQNPPGGLAAEQVPQFVSLGFDDNAYPDAVHWIADFLRNHDNPPGAGNAATFDGTQMSSSFFVTGSYATPDGLIGANGATTDDVIAAWRTLYDFGLELGNHTYRHMGDRPVEEFTLCNDVLTDLVGVPEDEIYGFRAPFLFYTRESFDTRFELGFYYDTSIEQPWTAKSGADDYWPFTLDHQSPYSPRESLPAYPGLWELPVYTLMIAGSNRIQTGFDFNLWVTEKLDEDTVFQTLVDALDARYDGNRAPMLFGAHTDEYSQHNTAFNQNSATNSTWQGRRETIENFLLHAASKPDVRIVSHIDIIRWMEDPVALGNCSPSCAGKSCGHDGCGGVCGTCPEGSSCGAEFSCVDDTCIPQCDAKNCGSDGCGNLCGTCGTGETCQAGVCEPDGGGECAGLPTWQLNGAYDGNERVAHLGGQYECKGWPFNGWCGQSPYEPAAGAAWRDAWTFVGDCSSTCTPDCSALECGLDGCGSTCGSCGEEQVCEAGLCVDDCVPGCGTQECGVDDCGLSCGSCSRDQLCESGTCVDSCVPGCGTQECGVDDCGNSCGSCSGDQLCESGTCVDSCVPGCGTRECGVDDCGNSCGSCSGDQLCDAGTCVDSCVPGCGARECGVDDCGDSCGSCEPDASCDAAGTCRPDDTDNCQGLPDWALGSYSGGDEVRSANQRFSCKPWPYEGWCGLGAYEPGVGFAWTDAWQLLGECG